MTIAFQCGNCGKQFTTDASLAGKKCRCKQCGHIFVIPSSAGPNQSSSPIPTGGSAPGRSPRADAPADPARPRSRPEPSPRSQPATPFPDANDPYGLDDLPTPPPRVAIPDASEDEEFFLPRASKPARSQRKPAARGSAGFFGGLPGRLYLAIFSLLAVLFVFWAIEPSAGGRVFTLVALGIGVLLGLYGNAGLLILPFREAVAQGLLCLFVPFYGLYYLITRWSALRGAFLASLVGSGIILAPALFQPAFAAARLAAERARQHQGAVAVAHPPGRSDEASIALPVGAGTNTDGATNAPRFGPRGRFGPRFLPRRPPFGARRPPFGPRGPQSDSAP